MHRKWFGRRRLWPRLSYTPSIWGKTWNTPVSVADHRDLNRDYPNKKVEGQPFDVYGSIWRISVIAAWGTILSFSCMGWERRRTIQSHGIRPSGRKSNPGPTESETLTTIPQRTGLRGLMLWYEEESALSKRAVFSFSGRDCHSARRIFLIPLPD